MADKKGGCSLSKRWGVAQCRGMESEALRAGLQQVVLTLQSMQGSLGFSLTAMARSRGWADMEERYYIVYNFENTPWLPWVDQIPRVERVEAGQLDGIRIAEARDGAKLNYVLSLRFIPHPLRSHSLIIVLIWNTNFLRSSEFIFRCTRTKHESQRTPSVMNPFSLGSRSWGPPLADQPWINVAINLQPCHPDVTHISDQLPTEALRWTCCFFSHFG